MDRPASPKGGAGFLACNLIGVVELGDPNGGEGPRKVVEVRENRQFAREKSKSARENP